MDKRIKATSAFIFKHSLFLALLLSIIFISLAAGLGHYSNEVIPGNPSPTARYLAEPGTHLDFLAEWDSVHYIHIAQHGYTDQTLTAFFPLYPLMIRLFMFVIHSPLLSSLTVSWLSLVGALYFYIKIIKLLFGKSPITIARSVMLFLFFPTGIFLAVAYTEAPFAFLALGAIYFAITDRSFKAGGLTALATATHPDGVLIAVLVALLLYESKAKLFRLGHQ